MGRFSPAILIAISMLMILAIPLSIGEGKETQDLNIRSRISSDLSYQGTSDNGMVSYIIQFKDGPNSNDAEFLKDIGFSIRRTFNVVPAISIEGPEGLLQKVLKTIGSPMLKITTL